MIARRDLFIGGACLASAAGAAALQVRHEAPLLKSGKLADIVPAAFGRWISRDMSDPYAINGEKTLSNKLYNELIVREYIGGENEPGITMLLAYGRRQTDELQLHRPEVCYPAFGFNVARNEPFSVPVGGSASLPVRRLAAESDDHKENIVYWSRMGEFLPQSGPEQRAARLKIAMQGILPDGLLSRFSIAGASPERDWSTIERFVVELLANVAPDLRKVLIGTERGSEMRSIPQPRKA